MNEDHGGLINTGCRLKKKIGDQKGASVILVALMMVVFISLSALAVDLAHLYLVRNELQNAADAGALWPKIDLFVAGLYAPRAYRTHRWG